MIFQVANEFCEDTHLSVAKKDLLAYNHQPTTVEK